MFGWSPATYHQPDNAIGLYRLELDVPADWKDRVVKLNFDGVQNGAEVYLNGQPVNVDESDLGKPNLHIGGFDAFQADLTPAVKFGEKNLLAVRVYKNTKYVDLDSGDYFFLGGIHRDVTLFSVPKTHVEDLTVRTHLLPENQAELRVMLQTDPPQKGVKASIKFGDDVTASGEFNDKGAIEIVQILKNPKLWSAEHPNLYDLSVDLTDASGKALEHVTRRIGVREVTIKDGIFLVNNVPVKFTGICRHDCYPTLGSALNEEAWRKDIELMKAANINAIRTSHYPYGSKFYDLCDELGMYVADEMAACWTPTDTDELTPAFAQHARELVRRDKNHACIVMWAIGNENKEGKNNKVSADEIIKMDPTRPRLVSWVKADGAGVELDDAHYTSPQDIAKDNAIDRRSKYPKTYLENPNDWEERNGADYGSLDLWGEVIARTWDVVWKSDHVPGSFLWEWQDRAVCDLCGTKLYDYFPATGINLVKVKGICDAFRNPRADYFHVKMAYAPIKVDLKPKIDGSTATVHVTNYLSFMDLSELTTTWRLLGNGKELKSDAIHPKLAAWSNGDVKFDLPAEAMSQADVLKLEFAYPDGRNIANYQLRLKPEADTTPSMDSANLAGVNFPHLNLVPVTYGNNKNGWHWAFRHPGKLVNIKVEQASGGKSDSTITDDALYAMPLSQVRAMDGDVVLAGDKAGSKPVARVHVDLADGKFSYHLTWEKPNGRGANGPADMQEVGWVFVMPSAVDHFSWHRQALWSDYPADHIGRPMGTATPDSADVDVTKITRPDAFDFNSTKYNCDWSMLADSSGKGLAVKFSPDDRQQCRAGTTKDGQRELVVNRYCCPPRDISTPCVPDLYLTLSQGQTVDASFTLGMTR
jgi:hypothetical protein